MGLNIKGSLVAAAAVLVSAGAWANSYKIVDLGPQRHPSRINAAGEIAATYRHGLATSWRVLERRDGKWHRLDTVAEATSIDSDGTVGGQAYDGGGNYTPYTWSPDGERHAFVLPMGATSGFLLALSNGMATGYYSQPDGGVVRCFLGSAQGGVTTDIGLMNGEDECEATGINSSGQISARGISLPTYQSRAFIWENGVFTDLGTLGGPEAISMAINDAGHIVGFSDAVGGQHAFLWKDGVMTDIGEADESAWTVANDVNNEDEVIGQELIGPRHWRAVRFAKGKVVDLASEVVNITGWRLQVATGINDAGVIVGLGSYLGEQHGFMLVRRAGR